MSAVTEQMAAPWNETTLPTLLSNHKLENVFNADKFGLPYQCLPTKTYHSPGEKCSGAKIAKFDWQAWQPQAHFGNSYPCLLLADPKHYDALKILSNFPANIEALDKLQDLLLFSSYGNEISSHTLKIETFLNKEQTEGLKQSHLIDLFQVVN